MDGFALIREAKNGSFIDDVLQSHQALIGIALGYGRDNAWKFHEGCKTRTPIGWVWRDEAEYFDEQSVPDDLPLPHYYLAKYSCPSFAGNPHSEESIALKAKYLTTRQTIVEYYKNKDFLEATLSLLAGHRP